jgi:hypothetical protein
MFDAVARGQQNTHASLPRRASAAKGTMGACPPMTMLR